MKIIEHTADFVMDALEFVGGIAVDAVRFLLKLAVAAIIVLSVMFFLRAIAWDPNDFEEFDSFGSFPHPYIRLIKAETATVSEMEC